MGGGFHHPSQVHFFYFDLIYQFFVLFYYFRAELALEASGISVAPPQHTWSATTIILPAVPPQGHHSNRTWVQPALSDSNSDDKPSTDDETDKLLQ